MASTTIDAAINDVLSLNYKCNLMLAGGETAKRVYKEWANSSSFPIEQIHFFFGDERCVSPEDVDSNFSLVMSSLFANGFGRSARISRIEGELLNTVEAARRYESLVPDEIDVLILGMGLDGHIASLFPGNPALEEDERSIVVTSQIGVKHDRITITPQVIARSKEVFLLATGREKGKLLAKALTSQVGYKEFPVCLTFGGTWLLDKDAEMEILAASKYSDSIESNRLKLNLNGIGL